VSRNGCIGICARSWNGVLLPLMIAGRKLLAEAP
jgi:hypothetical protein